MDIQKLLTGFFTCREIKQGVMEVKTPIHLLGSHNFVFVVERCDAGWRISDRKLMGAYLAKLFDLASRDVQTCVQDVLNINKVAYSKGEMFVVLKKEEDFLPTIANFLGAMCQLLKMQVFFENGN